MAISFISSLSFLVIFLYLFSGLCSGAIFKIENMFHHSIWLAASPGIGDQDPELEQYASRIFRTPYRWSGSIWARTGCINNKSFKFSCDTGDCGSGEVHCQGPPPKYPVTLLNFIIDKSVVSCKLSLIHGNNMNARIQPDGGLLVGGGTGLCPETGCLARLSDECPAPLVYADRAGNYAGCYSQCDKLGQCGPNDYTRTIKDLCSEAHTYVGDQKQPPHYQCFRANSYNITFCPF